MKARMLGVLAIAGLGVGAYLLLTQKDSPAPVAAPQAQAAAQTQPAAQPPALLGEVVELTDLDPLLDPPAKPPTGVPFDDTPVVPAVGTPAPERIPPAVD